MGLLDRVKKIQNRDFMEAVAAACAMVASVDGLVRPEEAAKVVDYAQIDDTLAVFDSFEVMETFEGYVRSFEFNYSVGRQKAFAAIRKLAGRREQARLLVLVAMAVADADGEFDNQQRLAVRDICRVAGLSLKEFDLDLKAPTPRDLPPSTTAPKRRAPPPEWMRDPDKAIERARAHQKIREEARKAPEPPAFPVPMPDSDSGDSVSAGRGAKGRASAHEDSREHVDSREGGGAGAPSGPHSTAPSTPERAKDGADLPEWMRNPPKPPAKIRPSAGSSGDSKKTSEPPAPDADLPEWMIHPPSLGASERRDGDSGGRGEGPGESPRVPFTKGGEKKNSDLREESLPEWMQNPPADGRPPSTAEDSRASDSGKATGQEGAPDSLPDWMHHPPAEARGRKKREDSKRGKPASESGADLPDWMRDPEVSSKKKH